MDFKSKYNEIQRFLSIPNDNFDLENIINEKFESDRQKDEILSKIFNFMFRRS